MTSKPIIIKSKSIELSLITKAEVSNLESQISTSVSKGPNGLKEFLRIRVKHIFVGSNFTEY